MSTGRSAEPVKNDVITAVQLVLAAFLFLTFVGWFHMVVRSYFYLEDAYHYPGILLLVAGEGTAIYLLAYLYE